MRLGYIKLARQLQEHPIWTGERFTRGQAWVDLLMLAQFTSYDLRIRGNRVHLDRGQIGHSKAYLAGRWKWDRKTVQKYLDDLENDGMITQQKTRVVTVITIVKYSTWQDRDGVEGDGAGQQNPPQTGQQDGQQNPQQDGQQNGHKEESKEGEKKVKKEEETGDTPQDIMDAWNATKGVRPIRKLTPSRIKHGKARLFEPDWPWREALARFPLQCFADGGWIPTLDWFLRPGKVTEILEGACDWSKGNGKPQDDEPLIFPKGTIFGEINKKREADRLAAEAAESEGEK